MHGEIVYLELSLNPTMVEETISFYQGLFGWTIQESFLSSKRYFMFQTPHHGFSGGLDENTSPSDSGVKLYIEVNDIANILSIIKSKQLSAKVTQEKTLISNEYGYYAIIQDPSSNIIGLQENSK